MGSGTSKRADTETLYGYSSGSERISQLRFVPASGFTGSVEIPYVACNSSGDPIASGKLCLGIVSAMEDFSDITSSTWCYKYVLGAQRRRRDRRIQRTAPSSPTTR